MDDIIDLLVMGALDEPERCPPHLPDDLPEPGDRCKHCSREITWIGPGKDDWALES